MQIDNRSTIEKTMRFKPQKTYWVKKATIPVICFLATKAIFYRSTIYYDQEVITPRAYKFLTLLSTIWAGFVFIPTLIDFNAKDMGGLNQRHRASHNLNEMAYRFLATHHSSASEREKQMLITYLWGYMGDKMQFITLIAEKLEPHNHPHHSIYIEPGPMNQMIASFFAMRGIVVTAIPNPAAHIRQWLLPYIYFLIVCWARLSPKKDNSNIVNIRPAVWVEYYYPWRNEHAFWREHINQTDFDLVYYLDRDDTPLEQDTTADIVARGMKWIDAHTLPIIRMSHLKPMKVWDFLVQYMLPSRHLPLWFRTLQFQERLWYTIYEAVFKRYQVKMLFQQQDLGWKQAIQAEAMEAAGGIMVGYHWSNLPHCWENVFLTSQHVYFVWGQAMRACLEMKKNTCNHILPSGIWIKPQNDESCREELAKFSRELDFTFTIFDSDVGHYWIMTPETLSQFFMRILSLLDAHPHWGAILKAKSSSLGRYAEVLPHGQEIIDRMECLRKQGRFVILNPKYLPMTAMAHSRLGVCYTINTAGIASGIYGHRAIHWECVGVENPIYHDPEQKILYKSLDGLENAILRAAEGDQSIGDFSKWQKWANYFGDYDGDKRVAWFIETFMYSINRTGDYKKSLDDSAEKYTSHYQVGDDFFCSEPCAVRKQ